MQQIFTNHEDIFSEHYPGAQNSALKHTQPNSQNHSQNFSHPAPYPYHQNADIRPIEEFISSTLFSDAQSPENLTVHLPNGSLTGQVAHLNPPPMYPDPQSYGLPDAALAMSPHEMMSPHPKKGEGAKHRTIPAAQRAAPKRGRSLMWALFGFMLGIIFWHFVGFWNFVNGALLTEPQSSRLGKEIQQDKKVEKVIEQTSDSSLQEKTSRPAAHDHTSCTDLVMNREKNETLSQACEPGLSFAESETSGARVARVGHTD